jgi:hypothetical protein
MTILTKNHAQLTIEVQKHIAADAVTQGLYWNGERGCFIGCLAHSSDATKLQDLYGLPLPLVHICERVFEGLPAYDAKAFFAAIPDAVGCDGKDLSRVHWEFLAAELRALPEMPADIQAVIDPVIAGMDLLAAGKEWPKDAARAAADAAAYAADAAADAAAYAAYAAADAADAARFRQRDTLLALIAADRPTQEQIDAAMQEAECAARAGMGDDQ